MPTQEEIDDVLNKCSKAADRGKSQWPGMSYEQGVDAGVRWMSEETDDNPMDD